MDTNSDLLASITAVLDDALSDAPGRQRHDSRQYALRIFDLFTFRDRNPSASAWLVDYAHRINDRIDYQIRHNLVGDQTMNELAELVMKSGVY